MIKFNFVVFLLVVFLSSLCFATADSSKSILLVIDMQKDILTPGKAGMNMDSLQIDSLIHNVNKNIFAADSLGIPVAYIQNLWTNPLWIFFAGNICRKGDENTNFDQRLKRINSYIYEKSVPNSFSNRKLSEYIKKHAIDTVYLCGVKTEGCVGATANASLKKGYTTYLIVPAIGSNSIKRRNNDIDKLVSKGAIEINALSKN